VTRRHLDVAPEDLVARAGDLLAADHRLALVAGHDDLEGLRLVYLFTAPGDRHVELSVSLAPGRVEVPSLAALSFSAGRFERELHDLFGVVPVGHPQPRPLVRHQHWPEGWHALRRGAGAPPVLGEETSSFPFAPIEGPGVYEIPVGPVHAGLIEPGHFRFWVVGETILRMKSRLWYLHRGVERHFEGRDAAGAITLAERVSGDSAVAHSLALTVALEEALGLSVDEATRARRTALLELERLYNHVGDLGAILNDVGFGLGQARAQVVRERLLRLNERVTGHRLLRGAIGVGAATLLERPTPAELGQVGLDVEDLVALACSNSIVVDRLEGTGVLPRDAALELGVVGLAARASGIDADARRDQPLADLGDFTAVVEDGGDVMARVEVRRREVAASLELVGRLLQGDLAGAPAREAGSGAGTGIVEGWRGPVAYRVEAEAGRLTRVKVVDPSFFNWPALSVALADTIVPDFPLVNKSFNLSYAGNDL
jgi:Ni,Fe-hydrogenase III large subunit/Ni,Fe-hydrogenase III component G